MGSKSGIGEAAVELWRERPVTLRIGSCGDADGDILPVSSYSIIDFMSVLMQVKRSVNVDGKSAGYPGMEAWHHVLKLK